MYLQDYFVFLLALLACMVFSMIASGKVKSAYSAYSRLPCRSGFSGRDAAERLLRETDRSITDIAAAAGFSGIRTFNRAFHRNTGMSPRAYAEEPR